MAEIFALPPAMRFLRLIVFALTLYGVTARQDGDPIADGDIVKVDVQGSKESPVKFILCSATCTTVVILGISDDFGLSYGVYTNSNSDGSGGQMSSGTVLQDYSGDWPSRSFAFVVQRRSSQVHIYLDSHPDRAVRAQLPSSGRIRLTTKGATRHYAAGTDSDICRKCRLMGGTYEVCRSTSSNHEPGAYALRKGVATVIGPEERISEKLKCDEGHSFCEVGFDVVKQFETQTGWSVGGEVGVAGTFGMNFIVELETTVHASLSGSHSWGWSNSTANSTTFHCQPNGGYTSWLTVKPEYYVKEADVVNGEVGCSKKLLKVLVPRIRQDGSIAGERHCKAEKIRD